MRSQHEYLSPKTTAAAIGVSESSLKRWVDEGRLRAERTAGGHRRIAVAEVVRFARQAGISLVRPDLLALPVGERSGKSAVAAGEGVDWLFSALVDDRATEARGLATSLFLGGASLGWICDVLIRESLSRIGELWEHDASGVFVEHRATETCLQMLADLASLVPRPPEGAPVALGGACEGDVYRVPSVMAALVLSEAGCEVRNLGPDTPVAATVAAIQHYRPLIVWQSFSVRPRSVKEASRGLERIAEVMDGGALVVGGRGSASLDLPRSAHRIDSMRDLSAFARGIMSP